MRLQSGETLDKYGFRDTLNILNEWNPSVSLRGTLQDSSNVLANMLALQNSSLDMLMYYDLRLISCYCGLFNPIDYKPLKTYYVFKAFNELYSLKNQVYSSCNNENVFVCCAKNNDGGAVLITNNSEFDYTIDIEGVSIKNCYLLSNDMDLEEVCFTSNIVIKPFETILLKI